MSKKSLAENKNVRETADVENYQRFLEILVHSAPHPIADLVSFIHHVWSGAEYTKGERLAGIFEKINRLDKRTLSLSSEFERLEADVDILKKEKVDVGGEEEWPSYAIEDFGKIVENIMGLESAGDDKSLVLYHIMEIEALLGKVEKKARVTNQRDEARLTASLRDICRVHEPKDLTKEQIESFRACLTALIEGWGKLNKEKVRWIRSRLLEVGLTWLPVTDKAIKDISQAQKIES